MRISIHQYMARLKGGSALLTLLFFCLAVSAQKPARHITADSCTTGDLQTLQYNTWKVATNPGTCFSGLQNEKGRWILQPLYEDVELAFPYGVIVKYKGKYGILNKCFKWSINPEFEELVVDKERHTSDIIYRQGDYYGLIDSTGKVIIQAQYKSLKFAGRERFAFQNDGDSAWGLLDKNNNKLHEPEFTLIKYLSPYSMIIYKKDSLDGQRVTAGVMGMDGRIIIHPTRYTDIIMAPGTDSVYCCYISFPGGSSGCIVYLPSHSLSFVNGSGLIIGNDSLSVEESEARQSSAYRKYAFIASGVSWQKKYLLDHDGRILLPKPYDQITRFSDTLFWGYNNEDSVVDLYTLERKGKVSGLDVSIYSGARLLKSYSEARLYRMRFDDYDQLEEIVYDEEQKNVALVARNGSYGLLRNDLKFLLPLQFHSIQIGIPDVIITGSGQGFYAIDPAFHHLNKHPLLYISLLDLQSKNYFKIQRQKGGLFDLTDKDLTPVAASFQEICFCQPEGGSGTDICGTRNDSIFLLTRNDGFQWKSPRHPISLTERQSLMSNRYIYTKTIVDAGGKIAKGCCTDGLKCAEYPLDQRFSIVSVHGQYTSKQQLVDTSCTILIPPLYQKITRYIRDSLTKDNTRGDTIYVCENSSSNIKLLDCNFKDLISTDPICHVRPGKHFIYVVSKNEKARSSDDGKATLSVYTYNGAHINTINGLHPWRWGTAFDRYSDTTAIITDQEGMLMLRNVITGARLSKRYRKMEREAEAPELLIVQTMDWKYGLLDRTGKIMIPDTFDLVNYYDGLAFIHYGLRMAIADRNGKLLTPFRYRSLTSHQGKMLMGYLPDSTIELLDRNGKVMISGKTLINGIPLNMEHVLKSVDSYYFSLPEKGKRDILSDSLLTDEQKVALILSANYRKNYLQDLDIVMLEKNYFAFKPTFTFIHDILNFIIWKDSLFELSLFDNMISKDSTLAFHAFFYESLKRSGISVTGCPMPGLAFTFYSPHFMLTEDALVFSLTKNVPEGTDSISLSYQQLYPFLDKTSAFYKSIVAGKDKH